MNPPLTIAAHLSRDELKNRMRTETDPTAIRRLQVIWLGLQGLPSKEIVRLSGYGRDWVFKIIKRYNEHGPDSLRDARVNSGGHTALLTPAQVAELIARLETRPDDGGLWTSPKVAVWMSEKIGRPVSFKVAWEYLKRIGFSLQQPRPSHTKADKEAQEAFKKGGFEPQSMPF
jgi:transposase